MRNPSKFAIDLTVQETCEVFRVTPPTVYSLIHKGELDSYVVGRSRRVTHESVARLRQSCMADAQHTK